MLWCELCTIIYRNFMFTQIRKKKHYENTVTLIFFLLVRSRSSNTIRKAKNERGCSHDSTLIKYLVTMIMPHVQDHFFLRILILFIKLHSSDSILLCFCMTDSILFQTTRTRARDEHVSSFNEIVLLLK